MRLAVVALVGLACSGRDDERRGFAPTALADGDGGSSAGPGSGAAAPPVGTAPRAPEGNRAAEPEGPTGEVLVSLVRGGVQGFGRGDLAVGGGWIYWIEKRRPAAGDASARGLAVIRRLPAAQPSAAPETVAGPATYHAIAADGEALFIAGEALEARAHGGGGVAPLASGPWLEIVPGARHLLVRSRDRVALVAKSGGAVETVWEGKHGKLSVDVDGDRFVAIPVSPWAQKSAKRAITVYAPGQKPAVLAELAEARGDLAIDGEWIYFAGPVEPPRSAGALWRLPRAGGAPERFGDPAWGFGEMIARRGVLYGMIYTGAWKLQKLALAPGAQPVAIEGRVPSMVQALAADERYLYYLTDFELRRAPR